VSSPQVRGSQALQHRENILKPPQAGAVGRRNELALPPVFHSRPVFAWKIRLIHGPPLPLQRHRIHFNFKSERPASAQAF